MTTAYKVGVEIALASNATQIFGALGQHFLGLNKQLTNFQNNWKKTALLFGGGLGVFGGYEILKGYGKLVQHGEKLVHYQTQLKAAGYSNLQIQEATNRAYQTGREILSSRYADNLRDIHHLASITGNFDEAMKLSPAFAATKQVLASLKDDKLRAHFEGDELQTYNFARSLEVMGITQKGPAEINKWVEGMTASMIAMRGLVDGTKFYQAVNLSGGAAMNWSMDFVTKKLPFLIQEMNAPAAGNALYMFQRGLVQGQLPKGSAEGLQKYGLIGGPQDYLTDASKRYLGLKPGSVKNSGQISSDPELWVRNTLLPALKAHGVDINNADQVSLAVGEIARNKNFLRMVKVLALQQAQIDKEIANVERVQRDGGAAFLNTDPSIMKKSFWSQWDNLLTVLGSAQVAPAYEVLGKMTIAIADMARALTQMDTNTLRSLGYGIAAIGTFLAVGGGVAILAALGPAGWLIGGLAALVVALKAIEPWLPKTNDMATNAQRNKNEGTPLDMASNAERNRRENQNFIQWYRDDMMHDIMRSINSVFDKIFTAIAAKINSLGSLFGLSPGDKAAIDRSHQGEGGIQNQRFVPNPGGGQRAQPISLTLNVDGIALARVVSNKMESLTRYERVATDFDGSGNYA